MLKLQPDLRGSGFEWTKALVLRGGFIVRGLSAQGGIHDHSCGGRFVVLWESASRVTLKAMRSEAFCGSKDRRTFWRSTSSS